ncbi:MAG: fatty acid desaturase family protein [Rhizobiales bacterium]|nr:fatty acid desaturase family protein [Hyphomicrobiales bacterium]
MNMPFEPRDYSLVGAQSRHAIEAGLANGEWYRAPIPRKRLKELMQRNDGPAIRDTIIWIAAFLVTGGLAWQFWPSLWSVPFFLAYGVLYGSSSDSRWHECSHGTAFKTAWMNHVVYNIACFMIMREPTVWRWSHTRHHTDTIIVGRDPEIAVMRPTVVLKVISMFFAIPQVWGEIKSLMRHTAGWLSPEEADFIPESERSRVFTVARIWLAIHLAIIALAIYSGSILPMLFIGPLPTMFGAWVHVMTGLTQHAGLPEDVLDHRLNSRTVYMNPVLRFIYWNMNYHVEHHMFPMVPYHQLPALHEEMKPYCPPPYPSVWAAYREIIPALLRQVREPGWSVKRPLPEAAVAVRPAAE